MRKRRDTSAKTNERVPLSLQHIPGTKAPKPGSRGGVKSRQASARQGDPEAQGLGVPPMKNTPKITKGSLGEAETGTA